MSPNLTNLQLISIGVAIAVATTFTTHLLLMLAYAEEICNYLKHLGLLHQRRAPRTNF